MYLPWPIGYGPNGLGAAEAEEGCDEPVSGEERDALRDRIQNAINNLDIHLHEGHPDIHAYVDDIYPRLDGLKFRPKLLRCSAEARDRAEKWLANFEELKRKVKRQVTYPRADNMTIVPAEGIEMPLYRGRTYFFRGPWFDKKFQVIPPGGGTIPITTPAQEVPKPPPREITTPPPEGGPESGVFTETAGGIPRGGLLPPEIQGIWNELTTGEVGGIPKAYLVYAVLGLLGYRLFFRR